MTLDSDISFTFLLFLEFVGDIDFGHLHRPISNNTGAKTRWTTRERKRRTSAAPWFGSKWGWSWTNARRQRWNNDWSGRGRHWRRHDHRHGSPWRNSCWIIRNKFHTPHQFLTFRWVLSPSLHFYNTLKAHTISSYSEKHTASLCCQFLIMETTDRFHR